MNKKEPKDEQNSKGNVMKTYIITTPCDMFERDMIENIEGQHFLSVKDLIHSKPVACYPLDYFTTLCNDEAFDLKGNWIGFVTIGDQK